MKTVVKFCFSLAFVLASVFGFSNAYFTVKNTGNKTFVLSMQQPLHQKAEFRIEDESGLVLFSETIAAGQKLSKKYNLSNLPAGAYTLSLEDDLAVRIQPVVLSASAITFKATDRKEIFKPVIRFNNGRVDFSILHMNDSSVEVGITDAEGNALFKESLNESGAIQRRYNLSNLPDGDYTVAVKVEGNAFYKTVSIR